MVPLKTEVNGNAPNMKKADLDNHGGEDVIDETIKAFRINVLFKHFTREGKRSFNLNNLFNRTSRCNSILLDGVHAALHKKIEK